LELSKGKYTYDSYIDGYYVNSKLLVQKKPNIVNVANCERFRINLLSVNRNCVYANVFAGKYHSGEETIEEPTVIVTNEHVPMEELKNRFRHIYKVKYKQCTFNRDGEVCLPFHDNIESDFKLEYRFDDYKYDTDDVYELDGFVCFNQSSLEGCVDVLGKDQ
jgi:hypothetical protein